MSMNGNNDYHYATSAVGAVSGTAAQEFNDAVRADALIHATLAVAYELRTANLIASQQPIRYDGQKEILSTASHAQNTVNQINARLGMV